MIKRRLKIVFDRSIEQSSQKPILMEVICIPLASPSLSSQDMTYVGEKEVKEVLLQYQKNEVFFDLVPTDYPGLSTRVTYRIAWRPKFLTGRTEKHDFAMPDQDVNFADLESLGAFIDSEVYLLQTDLGVPGRVCKLNDAGEVTDAFGNIVTGSGEISIVEGKLDAEIVARQQGDQFLRNYFQAVADQSITSVNELVITKIALAVDQLSTVDLIEKAARENAVNQLNTLITNLNAALTATNAIVSGHTTTLTKKADLVNGKIPSSQMPDIAITRAVPAANEAEMLALTDVQRGDICIRPDGSWLLNADDPSNISSWVRLTFGGGVTSVNGQIGAVVLGASDVGARPSSSPVPVGDISGLTALLSAKADVSTTTQLDNRLTTIETDTHIVKTNSSGLVARSILPEDVVFVNSSGYLVRKDGTTISTGGGGGPIAITDVIGLVDALNDKLDVDGLATPKPHASTHSTGGSDPIAPSDIGAATSGSVTTLGNRTTSLENRVDELESGSPGGGGGSSKHSVRFISTEPTRTSDFSTLTMNSPFGKEGDTLAEYYDGDGADNAEQRYPYVHKSGHLELRPFNPLASPDPDSATQTDLEDAVLQIGSLSTQLSQKAPLSGYNNLVNVVDGKADSTVTDGLATQIAGKASQSSVDSLTTLVNGKVSNVDYQADKSTFATLTLTNGLGNRITDLETALPNKSDLVGGYVPLSQIPTAIPREKIDGLNAVLGTKADLDNNGRVPTSQIPQDIPIESVATLVSTLASKADLVGGYIPTSQLPPLATNETYSVTSRAAMLALTSAQVQRGDICVITTGVDKGNYILNASDPSVFSNWVKFVGADGSVNSVNGQTGIVVLAASDVGARSSATPILQAEVQGLVASLGSKADTSAVNSALSGKTSPADVRDILTSATYNKQKADYVSTTSVASLAGQQSIDGVLVPLGSVILLTAQPSSANNGLYTVNSSAWTRVADMASGTYFVKGSLVVVGSGSTQANTLWQETNNSGTIGTDPNNWTRVLQAGPPSVYTNGNGLNLSSGQFTVRPTTGIVVTSAGVGIDTTLVTRKFSTNVPGGNTLVTITHNLGTLDISSVYLREVASGQMRLIGVDVLNSNAISIEFETAPVNGQYRITVTA